MRKSVFLVLCGLFISLFGSLASAEDVYAFREKQLGMKSEADVLYSAMWEVAKKVPALPGLANAKKVAVMVIREPGKTGDVFDLSSKYSVGTNLNSINPLGWVLQALFEPNTVLIDEKGVTPQGEHGYSHSPMFEDLIINALVQAGGYEVVEASGYFRGPLPEIMLKDSSLAEMLEDPKTAASIGKMLGVDTVIIGSVGVSQSKRIQKHSFFFDNQYFMANFRLSVRTVDVETNEITSADTYSGGDIVRTFRGFRITMLETLVIGLLFYVAEKD